MGIVNNQHWSSYDGSVVGRVCVTYRAQDLEWISRVPESNRKYPPPVSILGAPRIYGAYK